MFQWGAGVVSFFFKGKRASTFPLSGTLARVGRPPLHCTVNCLGGFGFPNHTHTHRHLPNQRADLRRRQHLLPGRMSHKSSFCPPGGGQQPPSADAAAGPLRCEFNERPLLSIYLEVWRSPFLPPALELEIDCGPPIYRTLAGCRYTSSHPSDRWGFLRVFLLTEVWATPAPHGAEIM